MIFLDLENMKKYIDKSALKLMKSTIFAWWRWLFQVNWFAQKWNVFMYLF